MGRCRGGESDRGSKRGLLIRWKKGRKGGEEGEGGNSEGRGRDRREKEREGKEEERDNIKGGGEGRGRITRQTNSKTDKAERQKRQTDKVDSHVASRQVAQYINAQHNTPTCISPSSAPPAHGHDPPISPGRRREGGREEGGAEGWWREEGGGLCKRRGARV